MDNSWKMKECYHDSSCRCIYNIDCRNEIKRSCKYYMPFTAYWCESLEDIMPSKSIHLHIIDPFWRDIIDETNRRLYEHRG